MKPRLSTRFFVIIFLLPCYFLLGKTRESLPVYYVSKTEIKSELKPAEALFILQFHDEAGNAISKKQIRLSDNGLNTQLLTDSGGRIHLYVRPGKHRFQFYYSKDYFEITTDSIAIKPRHQSKVEIYFQSSKYPVICDKPVIYLYPKEKTTVHLDLELNGSLGFTYPIYKNGWDVEAYPDGTLRMGGLDYSYLFWEGQVDIDPVMTDISKGFIVKRDSLVGFFEEKLTAMNLNRSEINDYITYWVPLMNRSEYTFIHFMFNEDYSQYAKLHVQPNPDSVFRVFMLWSDCERPVLPGPDPQQLPSFNRKGFAVLEWGGGYMPDLPVVIETQL